MKAQCASPAQYRMPYSPPGASNRFSPVRPKYRGSYWQRWMRNQELVMCKMGKALDSREAGGSGCGPGRARLGSAMLPQHARRAPHDVDVPVPQLVQRCQSAQARVFAEHEDHLHPRVVLTQLGHHPLQAGQCASLAELPDGIHVATPAQCQADELSCTPTLVYRLPRDAQERCRLVNAHGAALGLQQLLPVVQAA